MNEKEFIEIWKKFGYTKNTTLDMYRVLWMLCYTDAKSTEEIAEKLRFSEAKVKRILRRMREKKIFNDENKLVVSKDFPRNAYVELGMLGFAYEGFTQIVRKEVER